MNFREALDFYADKHIPTGDFLKAMLSNDLRAVVLADNENLRDIAEIYRYMYNELPSGCWGSPQNVKRWLEKPRCPNIVYHYHVEQGIEPDGNCMKCQKEMI